MSDKLIYVIIAIILLAIGGGYLYSQSNQMEPATENDSMMIENGEAMESDSMMETDSAMENDAMMDNNDPKEAELMMKDEENTVNDSMMKGEESMEEESMMEDQAQATGTYEAYDAPKVSRASNGDVILFFHASWCPTCRAADADINANLSSIPSGTTILKTNYDTETELRQKYGVTTQHTFVQVDAQGNMIKKWSGGNTLTSLLNQVS